MNVSRSRARLTVVRSQGRGARSLGAHWLRASWLRALALLVLLLGLVAQQRVLTSAVRPSTSSVARLVAERVQSIETHAVRADAPLRVAPAPFFARLPPFSEPVVAWPNVRSQAYSVSSPASPACASIGHFHGQRRIPRMNSEEPPRA